MKRINEEMARGVVLISIVAVLGSLFAFLSIFGGCQDEAASTPYSEKG